MQRVRRPLLRGPELVHEDRDAGLLVDDGLLAVPAPLRELALEIVERQALVCAEVELVLRPTRPGGLQR